MWCCSICALFNLGVLEIFWKSDYLHCYGIFGCLKHRVCDDAMAKLDELQQLSFFLSFGQGSKYQFDTNFSRFSWKTSYFTSSWQFGVPKTFGMYWYHGRVWWAATDIIVLEFLDEVLNISMVSVSYNFWKTSYFHCYDILGCLKHLACADTMEKFDELQQLSYFLNSWTLERVFKCWFDVGFLRC